MTVTFYNTRSRAKETFKPLIPGKVGIYSCGPTVYHHSHIGNMRSFIFADLLRRVMEHAGYQVKHVMNITDVGHLVSDDDAGEDKMEVGKQREGLDAWGVAEKYTESFMDHCHKLNILPPHIICKATEHIEQQIALVKKLESRGFTYVIEDGVYFDTSKFEAYGAMAKLDIEGLEGGKRITDIGKKHKTDFALWKFSPKGSQRDMEWDSPWGRGFPGWHIECSAMSMHYLGEQFDIHTGGIDHIPIHHTNEIAQSEAASDKKPFVNYWLHNEFLQLGEGLKMSKSKGGFLTVDSLTKKKYDPLAFRYLMLTAHYRNPVKFSWESLDAASATLKKLAKQALQIKHETGAHPAEEISDHAAGYINRFDEAIFDDLNSAVALAELHSLLGDDKLTPAEKMALLMYFEPVLHLGLFEEHEIAEIPAEIIDFAKQRLAARDNKDWAEADRLRKAITDQGYDVMDNPDGFEVFKK